jgi:quercetin dioxygenase-like cupin family protein
VGVNVLTQNGPAMTSDHETRTASGSLQIETDFVRVTRWDFEIAAETGWHRHEHDYVVVPVTDARVEIRSADGITEGELVAGRSYARSAPVEHNVVNIGAAAMCFVEVELLG